MPIATERLNALTPQFFNGLIAYDTIGARNTSDQKAREYASGTSSPVGFKNTTEGSIKTATEAVVASRAPHTFLGMNEHGRIAQVRTGKEKDGEIIGNEYGHIILRGDNNGPNYSVDHIEEAKRWIKDKSIPEAIIVDASHGNSMRIENGAKKKDHTKQIEVIQEISRQVSLGETAIKGVMIEANLKAGKQDFEVGVTDPASLEKGKSITDACVDLEESEKMLGLLHGAVIIRRQIILSTSV